MSEREKARRALQSARDKLAYFVDDLPYGRTYTYKLIKQGKLKAKKSGRRTIITQEAWKEHLEALPELGEVA
jgi:excisionase family DNA binding protein